MKPEKKPKKSLGEKIRGSINVFVAMMLIPTVAFTGILIDFARIRMMGAEIHNAADLGASSAISYYDGLLKDVYGLFAVSQGGGEQPSKFVVDYVAASLGLDKETKKKSEPSYNLIGTGKSTIDVTAKYEVSADYSLRNPAFFQQQATQYMKYRIIFSLLELFGIYNDNKSSFEDGGEKAKKEKNLIEGDFSKLLKLHQEVSESYKKLYDEIMEVEGFNSDSKKGRPAIDGELAKAVTELNYILTDSSDGKEAVKSSAGRGSSAMSKARSYANDYSGKLKNITNYTKTIVDKTKEFDALAANLLKDLEDTNKYSENFRETMTAQIKELKDGEESKLIDANILKAASDRFVSDNKDNFDRLANHFGNLQTMFDEMKNTADEHDPDNAKNPKTTLPIQESWFTGTLSPKVSFSVRKVIDGYYTFDKEVAITEYFGVWDITVPDITVVSYDDTPPDEPLSILRKWAINEDSDAVKKAKEQNKEKQKEADEKQKEADETVKKESSGGKSVPDVFWNGWKGTYLSGNAPGSGDNFGDKIVNRILLMEYGFQELTNYNTDRKIGDDGKKIENPQTLSGIPKTKDGMNYLYQREMEYVVFGMKSGNFEAFVAIMTVIFFVANYLCTFAGMCGAEVTSTISALRAIPFVGFVLAEVFRIIAAAAETAWDVGALMLQGKRAAIIKTSSSWWFMSISYDYDSFANKGGLPRSKLGLYYDEYLRLFLLLDPVSNNTLANRLMNVIELNMNYYLGDTGPDKYDNAKFLAKKAYVSVDVSVDVNMPYFFIPMPFISRDAAGNTNAFEFKGITKSRGY